ncbi:MAG: DUF2797 domain-containing protein [Bacteroidota bacterium]
MSSLGNLSKMRVELADPIQYTLQLGEEAIPMNEHIGKEIKLSFTGQIHCKICGRKTKKAYGEGFCYPHFRDHPANSPCIIKPELCEGHLGKGRDVEWEQEHHVQPHVVYLALTDAVKVGVTRSTQVPTRWIDQGAWQTIKLAEVPYRKLAGDIEVSLKAEVTDKTNWRKMLTNVQATDRDLVIEKQRLIDTLPPELQAYASEDDEVWELSYPVEEYPGKVSSLSLDKQPEITEKLMGIRGQYWYFEGGKVINIRRHTGYQVELDWGQG